MNMPALDWCAAEDPEMPNGCAMEPERYYRGGCVHEHIREGWLCEWHLGRISSAFCRVCHELGHDCKLLEVMTDDRAGRRSPVR